MSKQVFNTTIHLNLAQEADRRAWAYLQGMDRKKYPSYSRAIVVAVNDFFERQERLAGDPYLETREKEDAFLEKVMGTIEKAIQGIPVMPLGGGAMQFWQGSDAQNSIFASEETAKQEEENSAALDFLDSF